MHRLPAHTVPFYNDGPDAPWTPILAEAERAYRHAYSIGAWQTLRWQEPDDELIERLWLARKAERQLAEVYVPSSFMFGDPRMDSEQIVYREGHDIDAALARGKHQAVELARQCWDELADQGFPEEDIAPLVFRPWYEAVLKWATGPVEPTKISAAPRPEAFVPGQNATVKPAPAIRRLPRLDRSVGPAGVGRPSATRVSVHSRLNPHKAN